MMQILTTRRGDARDETTADVPVPAEPDMPPAGFPLSSVTANLLPDEVRTKRRLDYLKRRMIFVLVALLLLVGLGDALARQQTSGVSGDLNSANDHVATLTKQLNGFDKMLTTQSETQAIWTQLDGVMGNDVTWSSLVVRLRDAAPAGVQLTSVGAQVDDADGTSDGTSVALPVTGDPTTLGSLTLSGTAPSWQTVADYVRALSAVRGVTAVNPSTVSGSSDGPGSDKRTGLTFTIAASLTDAALSHRYASASTAPAEGATGSGGAAQNASPAGSATSPSGAASSAAAQFAQQSADAASNATAAAKTRSTGNRTTPDGRSGSSGQHGHGKQDRQSATDQHDNQPDQITEEAH